jgi:hypothetical protein
MDADVVLTLGSCIKRKQIFSELTELNKILLLNRKKLCQIQLSFKLNIYRVFRFIGHNSIYMYTIPPTGLNFLHALQMLKKH